MRRERKIEMKTTEKSCAFCHDDLFVTWHRIYRFLSCQFNQFKEITKKKYYKRNCSAAVHFDQGQRIS